MFPADAALITRHSGCWLAGKTSAFAPVAEWKRRPRLLAWQRTGEMRDGDDGAGGYFAGSSPAGSTEIRVLTRRKTRDAGH